MWDVNICTNATLWRKAVVAQICFHGKGLIPLPLARQNGLDSFSWNGPTMVI